MCGFNGFNITTLDCQIMVTTSSSLGMISLGSANILILMRVVLLWDGNRRVRALLTVGFLISWMMAVGFMVATLVILQNEFDFNPFVRMCVTKQPSWTLIGVWASPMLFELMVLIATCFNAVDRPTAASMSMQKALQRDGIIFFVALTILRGINLAFAATMNSDLVMIPLFFVWSMTTLCLNRCLLSSQRSEAIERLRMTIENDPQGARSASPFGIQADQLDDLDISVIPEQLQNELEMQPHPMHRPAYSYDSFPEQPVVGVTTSKWY